MRNEIKTFGIIQFDPLDLTNKHELQASWKKVALVNIEGDISQYYAWFLKKRFNLTLNPPIRNSHVTFINDKQSNSTTVLSNWEDIKKKWNGVKIPIILNVSPRTDGKHWWLKINEEDRVQLHSIREELGLGRPHWGLHLSIGYANEKNIAHSRYIHDGITNGFIPG